MALWAGTGSVFLAGVNKWGMAISIQNKKETFAAGSYDEAAWADSGTKVTGSAFLMPISMRIGGDEAQLIEQGQITLSDRKAYIPSGLEIHEKADVVIDGGSYDLIGIKYEPNATSIVYTKIFIRSKI